MTTGFCSNGSSPPALALLVSWFFSLAPYIATPFKFLGGVLNLPLLPLIPIQSNSVKQKTLKSTSSLHPSICQSGSVKALHIKEFSQKTRLATHFQVPSLASGSCFSTSTKLCLFLFYCVSLFTFMS